MSLPTIDCKECGHVNEGERVYCHNCGAKLDRSVLLTTQKEQESIEQKQRRIKKMMNPDSGLGRNWWKTGLKTVGAAALTAALVDSVLPPENIPPMPKKEELVELLQLDIALENLAVAPAGTQMSFKQDEINTYLKNKVRLKYDGNLLQNFSSYQRSFVTLSRGVCQITMQNAVADYPLYFGLAFQLSIQNVKGEAGTTSKAVVATPVGANIGRLSFPGIVGEYGGLVFAPLWDTLKREHRLLDQAGAIEVRKGEMIFTARGQAPAVPGGAPTSVPVTGPARSSSPLGAVSSLRLPGLSATTTLRK